MSILHRASSVMDPSMAGMELMTRNSMNSLRHPSQISMYIRESLTGGHTGERNWSWSHLRTQFRIKGLEDLYTQYQKRLHHAYFSVFLMLLICLCLFHIGVLLGFNWKDMNVVVPDVFAYSLMVIVSWPLLVLACNEKLLRDYPSVLVLLSCLVVLGLICVDVGIPLYYYARDSEGGHPLRPFYIVYIVLACYMFLPFPKKYQAVILGVTTSLCEMVILGFITYRKKKINDRRDRLIADGIYLACINALGLYLQFINEIVIRRTFLDRRACLESTLTLNYEKDQEERLMLSILPKHIATQVKAGIRKIFQDLKLQGGRPPRKKPFSELYVEKHNIVSILYADVVNFSKLTVSLPVNKLVETLNELFGRFDEASEVHGVLRIKFLGDCYYCVCGVPQPNPFHAKNCVELGLDMINIIRQVRSAKNVNIDMRIGVHSGKILSGLLGVCKWQFDIWSRDVDIANRMEQTGRPGRVHVTNQTLKLLSGQYQVERSDGDRKDPYLRDNHISTYLIIPPTQGIIEDTSTTLARSLYNKRASIAVSNHPVRGKQSRRPTITVGENGTTRRRTVPMDDSLTTYRKMLNMADIEMGKAIDKMPLGKYDQWFRAEQINPLFLSFKDKSWEIPFLREKDPLFKFYVATALVVLLCMLLIQCLVLPSSHRPIWISFGIALCLLMVLIPITWSNYVWNRVRDPHEEQEIIPEPRNTTVLFFYNISQYIVGSLTCRTLLYIIITAALSTCSMVDLIECDFSIPKNTLLTKAFLVQKVQTMCHCSAPWQLTETVTLAITVSYLFLRFHYILKLVISTTITVIYSVGIYYTTGFFVKGETTNIGMPACVAHILYVSYLTFTLHIMDRQAEYMNRLDFIWKRQLADEMEDASTTRMVNKLLLQNILPVHVAEVYLSRNAPHDLLYHEEYESVAVMFASLQDIQFYNDSGLEDDGIGMMKILNEVICEFDKLLFQPAFSRVEKIKVAGWTYMAACGLDPGRRGSSDSSFDSSRSHSSENIMILARFAASMMNVLQEINIDAFQEFKLRVGISHGSVMAGVVGAQKPFYDIWGDTVNMASRMDSTGVSGFIQVTENTGLQLRENGISCTPRGLVKVKGKDKLQFTYFIDVNSAFELVKRPESDDDDEDIDIKL